MDYCKSVLAALTDCIYFRVSEPAGLLYMAIAVCVIELLIFRTLNRNTHHKYASDPASPEAAPAKPPAKATPECSHRLTEDLMGNIITLYLVSLFSTSTETIRGYRLQGNKKLPQALAPLILSAKSVRDLTTDRWRTMWATCGHKACPLHTQLGERMGLAPDNRIITTNEGCLAPDADLSPYSQLLHASINHHGDWKWDNPSQSFRRWQRIVAFPASLTRLEMLRIHGGEEEIIATVSRCCPKLVELRLVRCTMFNRPDCPWWRQHDHDYFQDPAEDRIISYANNVVESLLCLSNLQVLHLGHYLMNKQAIDIHRVDHARHHPFRDELNPFVNMGVSTNLEAIARQSADGGPPINMQVPPLARRGFWETPCPMCRDQLATLIEGTEHLTTSLLARLGSLRMVSFPNFLSEKGIQPCNWHIKREIGPSIQAISGQWEEVDEVGRTYEDGTRMRVTVTGERSRQQLPPFTFTMHAGAWEL